MAYLEKKKRIKDEEVLALYRLMKCAIHGRMKCYGRIAGHHIKTRATGGGDVHENLIPLCAGHHTINTDSIHQLGPRLFLDRHWVFMDDLDLLKIKNYVESRGL